MEVELEVVARNLAEYRRLRGFTLKSLADATGYTPSYISQLERGASVPSLSGLATVAGALGVEMRTLFEQASEQRIHVTRSDQAMTLRTGPGEHDRRHRYTVLASHGADGAYSMVIHHFPADETPVEYRLFGERFGLVIDGTVVITIAGDEFQVPTGESIHYGSHETHTVAAADGGEATVLWVVSPAII